jgi:hypothetical protein
MVGDGLTRDKVSDRKDMVCGLGLYVARNCHRVRLDGDQAAFKLDEENWQ